MKLYKRATKTKVETHSAENDFRPYLRFLSADVLLVMVIAVGSIRADDWSPLWSSITIPRPRRSSSFIAVGNKLIVAGGYNDVSQVNWVDIYDISTNSWSTASLTKARYLITSVRYGTKAYFAGGFKSGGVNSLSTIDIFDSATNSWSVENLSEPRYWLAATTIGTKILFGGGEYDTNNFISKIDIFDTMTNSWSTANLTQARSTLAAASIESKAFFGGGWAATPTQTSNVVDIYDSMSNTWIASTLSDKRDFLCATAAGGKVFFAGGRSPSGYTNLVDIFDTVTNSWSTASMSTGRAFLAAASVGSKAFFAGGFTSYNNPTNVVDIYDTSTNSWSITSLSRPREMLSACTSGNKVYFGPGDYFNTNIIDYYTLQNYDTITSANAFTLVDDTVISRLMQLNTGANLNLGSYNLNIGSMSGVGPINLSNKTLTTGSDNTSTSYSGAISGSGTLIKNGIGCLTLTASNLYTGTTKINGGMLAINGSLASASLISVENSGVLTGTGAVGTVNVVSGGHIAPGNANGTLHLSGNLTLDSGAMMDFEVGTPARSDLISMPFSTLFLNNQQFSDFNFTPKTGFAPGDYKLIDARSISGSLDGNISGMINGLDSTLIISGGDLVLRVVPEPSTLALLGMGAISLLIYAWRQRMCRNTTTTR
jgi:autotransporter-associated beta strand protein